MPLARSNSDPIGADCQGCLLATVDVPLLQPTHVLQGWFPSSSFEDVGSTPWVYLCFL